MFATCETSRLVPDELSASGSLEEVCPFKPVFLVAFLYVVT